MKKRSQQVKDSAYADSVKCFEAGVASNQGSTAINEFTMQLEQMRHSQQPQAVQPMIFNFFNSKSQVK